MWGQCPGDDGWAGELRGTLAASQAGLTHGGAEADGRESSQVPSVDWRLACERP